MVVSLDFSVSSSEQQGGNREKKKKSSFLQETIVSLMESQKLTEDILGLKHMG